MTRRSAAAAIFLTTTLVLISSSPARAQATLEKFASLPADSFAPGPTSGQFIATANGRVPPFEDKQPIQGISSVLQAWNGDFLVMSDNGFGAKDNSQDYVLRVYRIRPSFRTNVAGAAPSRPARSSRSVTPIAASTSPSSPTESSTPATSSCRKTRFLWMTRIRRRGF